MWSSDGRADKSKTVLTERLFGADNGLLDRHESTTALGEKPLHVENIFVSALHN